MAQSISGLAIYISPGMQIKVAAPVNGRNSEGYFTRTEDVPKDYFKDAPDATTTPLRGFILENNTVGSIKVTDATEAAVIYTHNQPYPNAIWFFARTGERGLIKVISVPIHDHSTIIQGGPAYGTYFDDDIER